MMHLKCKLSAVEGQEDCKLWVSSVQVIYVLKDKTKHFLNMYNKQLGRGYVIINLDTLNDFLLSQPASFWCKNDKWKQAVPV